MHLWLADTLGDDEALAAAVAAGEHLLSAAVPDGAGGLSWRLLPEVDRGTWLGYAHGAAGIADVLLDLAEVTGHDRYRDAAVAAARWILAQATRSFGGDHLAFPAAHGADPWTPFWCHGSTGIGRFLLHLDDLGLLEDRPLLTDTAVAAARLTRFTGPALCHGIASSIDHLLDLHAATGDPAHLTEAWSADALLDGFERRDDDGRLRSVADAGPRLTFDLMSGYAGVAAVWLRLADPTRPSLLAGRHRALTSRR